MTQVFMQYDEATGKEFRIHYDANDIIQSLQNLIDDGTVDENGHCDEYPIRETDYGRVITNDDRSSDINHMQNVITLFENAKDDEDTQFLLESFLGELIDAQPKKKNGSLAKNRVNDVGLYYSYAVYWEDHYGHYTPAIRVRSYDDYDCKLLVESYIVSN